MYNEFISFVRDTYNRKEGFIPLHEPRFNGNEKKYVEETIDSTFVSSVGAFVDKFEAMIASYTGSKFAIATVNGTSALQVALLLADVKRNDEVITQPLTFVATVNAISYTGAKPIFLDVDKQTLGLSANALETFLHKNTEIRNGACFNKTTGGKITACVPMHTFGFPCEIDRIVAICEEYKITVIEDSAESLGSTFKNQHTGTFGKLGVFSLNGNKTITCGGGGAIITDDEVIAKKGKHLTTTAKVPHSWEYTHDIIGFNYRMPNINAALACAQLEQLGDFIENKRILAKLYHDFFESRDIEYIYEPKNTYSNYWLNAILLPNKESRDTFLKTTNASEIMTRPIWTLMNKLPMYSQSQTDSLKNAEYLESRVVNIPSSVRL